MNELTKDSVEVEISTYKIGWNEGGQNVNWHLVGVKAVYIPTGLSVTCEEFRTAHLNRQGAIDKLNGLLRGVGDASN